jgi:hypothetical protein
MFWFVQSASFNYGFDFVLYIPLHLLREHYLQYSTISFRGMNNDHNNIWKQLPGFIDDKSGIILVR